MLRDQVTEPLRDLERKVPANVGVEMRVARQRRVTDRLLEAPLRVREQDAELRPRHAAAGLPTLGHLLSRGGALAPAFEQVLRLELRHETLVSVNPFAR